jgi:glutamine synthetase
MAMHLSRITGAVKYAHSEAGFIESLRSGHPVLAGRRAEQHEIELLARPAAQMADIVALARWVIRGVACRHGLLVTFAPKIDAGVPGNGLHVHVELLHGEDSAMSDAQGGLSSTAHRLIGGLMKHASSLCAFGNTAATSYLRLVPGLEAPTQAEWSDSDRSALVRVPLACRGDNLMVRAVNPTEPMELVDTGCRQTVEWRLADGSAHPHRLLAGIATAATWGLTRAESLELARATKASPRTSPSADGGAALEPLPPSCGAAAQSLLRARRMYEADGVFPPAVIDLVVEQLRRRQAASLCSDGHPAGRHGLGQERSAMDNDMMAL